MFVVEITFSFILSKKNLTPVYCRFSLFKEFLAHVISSRFSCYSLVCILLVLIFLRISVKLSSLHLGSLGTETSSLQMTEYTVFLHLGQACARLEVVGISCLLLEIILEVYGFSRYVISIDHLGHIKIITNQS